MKTLHFTDATGIMRTETNVKNIKIVEEPLYLLTLKFNNGTVSKIEGEYDYIKKYFNDNIDNSYVIELNIKKS